jgi:uncharacterized protein (TIGR03437 family)
LFGGTVQQLPALPSGATAQALQVDAAGNIYVAGSLPPKNPKSAADKTDAFAAKLSADGSKVLYFTVLGGSGTDAAVALAAGFDDSVYVTGTTSSSDFPVTKEALQTVYGGQMGQAFAVKLDANGAMKYATYIGGTVDTAGVGIVIDSAGDAFLLGSGEPTGVAPIAGGDPATLGGFVVKLDPTGSKMQMGFAGLGGEYIGVDGEGNVYLAGLATPPLTPPLAGPTFTPGALQTSEPNGICGGDFVAIPCPYEYVAKVDPGGTKIIYLTGLNGTYGASPAGVAVDADGNAIVAGTTYSPDFPVTPDTFESLYAPVIPPTPPFVYPGPHYFPPPATGFVAKLNAAGSALVWSTFFGGSVSDSITSMAVDSEGGIVLAGQASSSDLPGLTGAPTGCLPSSIQELSFAVRLTPDATSATPAQLFYGATTYVYGTYNPTGPIAVASSVLGSVVGLEKNGRMTAANLLAPSRVACVTDPADNAQILSVAAGQYLTLFGTDLTAPQDPLTATVNVTFNGVAADTPYLGYDQVNVQVPAQIAGQTTATMEVTDPFSVAPFDEKRTLPIVLQQPSVFLDSNALAGAASPCLGAESPSPGAVALNADGSRNSVDNPAAAGSMVTIFLNGVDMNRWISLTVTGMANDNPVTFTVGEAEANNGVLPVSFIVPKSATNGVTLSQLQVSGTAVRERSVAVCVTQGG